MKCQKEEKVVTVNLRLPLFVLDKIETLSAEWGLNSRSEVIEKIILEILDDDPINPSADKKRL